MINFISLIIALLSFITLQENSAIKKVQDKFVLLKNFQSDFIQLADNKIGLQGKFYFSKDNNYRIELKNNIIISDGKTIWNYDKKRNRVIISNLQDDPLSFSLKEYVFDYPSKCNITEKRTASSMPVVVLNPKNSELNFKEAQLFLTDEYLIKKITVKDFNGGSFSFKFNNIKIDKNLKSKLFKFENNAGAKIIDLR